MRLKMEMQKILLSLDLEDGELRQLFNELEMLNKALKSCFEKLEVPSAETVDNRVVKRLHACFNADQCIAASHNARVLHGALRAGWVCTCSTPHKGGLRLMWHTKKWLSSTDFEMALSCRSASASSQQEIWNHVEINVAEALRTAPPVPEAVPKQTVPSRKRLPERLSKTLKRVRIHEDTVTRGPENTTAACKLGHLPHSQDDLVSDMSGQFPKFHRVQSLHCQSPTS